MLGKLWKRVNRRKAPPSFTGPYATWAEAKRHSTGYDAANILEKTRVALGKVRDGEAVYERDSVLFPRIEHSFGLLAGLQRAALELGPRLTILDFGGALGSTYYQCRGFLGPAIELDWWIVEQAKHVECGQAEFTSANLHFALTVEDVLRQARPDVLVLSSVIHYLDNPHAMLEHLLRQDIPYFIVDRTPFLKKPAPDLLCVQHVPPSIYEASFPIWFLDRGTFLERMKARYEILAEFEAQPTEELRLDRVAAQSLGIIARKDRRTSLIDKTT